jgi:predicted GIY-YIG superfamily endonuclease
MVSIYILQLKKGKYYIGSSHNPKLAIKTHFTTDYCEWTRIYKPKSLIKIIPNCDEFEEDKITLKYMKKYDIENVRGGSFCEVNFDDVTFRVLQKMVNKLSICCNCGLSGHVSNDCGIKLVVNYKPKFVRELSGKEIYELGKFHYDIEDYESSIRFCQISIEKGNEDAMILLANYYYKIGDYKNTIKYYEMAIDRGNSYAMGYLADVFKNLKDRKSAIKYYEMAIEMDNVDAMFNLGVCYCEKLDYVNGIKYLSMAVNRGNVEAMHYLGSYYHDIIFDNDNASKYFLMGRSNEA